MFLKRFLVIVQLISTNLMGTDEQKFKKCTCA